MTASAVVFTLAYSRILRTTQRSIFYLLHSAVRKTQTTLIEYLLPAYETLAVALALAVSFR
jgi:hypothetical protein